MSTLRALHRTAEWQVKQCIYTLRCSHGHSERRLLSKWSPLFASKNDDEHSEATINSFRGRDMQFNSRHVQAVDEDAMDMKHEFSYDETGEIRSKERIADSRMNIYESNNINLSSCMQSTVPQPFDGTKCGSDHVSPINMPGGGSGRDVKYVSGNMHDMHQSRHFSTFVRRMQANKSSKTDSEFVVKARFLEDSIEYRRGYAMLKGSRDFLLSFTLVYIVATGLSYIVYSLLLYNEVPFDKIVDVSRMAKVISKMKVNEDEFSGLTQFEVCSVFAKCHVWYRLSVCVIIANIVTQIMLTKKVRFYGPINTLIEFDKWLAKKVKQ